jgi:hypothetical protein
VIGGDDTLRFFTDDSVTGGNEYSGGAVARIRLYDGPLAGAEVARACAELRGRICGRTRKEYVDRAFAICEAAQVRFRAAIEEFEADDDGFYEFAARWTAEVLAELRAEPPPEPIRARFEGDYARLERESEALRRAAETGELDLGEGPAAHFIQQSLQGCTAGG